MSSWKKAFHARAHRERAQPGARKHLGLLEKHKDYVQRAKSFHSKERRLRRLKEKAAMRNEEEFYFRMQSSQVVNGVHVDKRGKHHTTRAIKEMKTQDIGHLTAKKVATAHQSERLQNDLHFLAEVNPVNKHTVFVDSPSELENWSAANHFHTKKEFLDRSYNRPTEGSLADPNLFSGFPKDATPKQIAKIVSSVEHQKTESYRTLKKKIQQEKKLALTIAALQAEKDAMGKGPKRKVTVEDEHGNKKRVMRWKKVRKS